jgi:glycosyltransferase involved in cell wall biosynthesis
MGALTSMIPAVVARRLYKKPLMFWSQDLWPDSVYAYGFKKSKALSYALDLIVKYIYRSANSIAITGKGFESRLSEYIFDKTIISYMPNWADDLDMSVEPIILSNEDLIQFTFAGNIGKVQNLENIIKAFCSLPEEMQVRAQFNIIGDGSNLNKLKLLFKKNKNIIFHGKKNREVIAKYYKASDFLVVSLIDKPIFSITVPAKTQTYIAAKKPILGFINGDTADLIRHNNLGLCAGPSNISDIAEIYSTCIKMTPTERETFTVKNDFLLQEIFNKERTINSLLKSLISSNSY